MVEVLGMVSGRCGGVGRVAVGERIFDHLGQAEAAALVRPWRHRLLDEIAEYWPPSSASSLPSMPLPISAMSWLVKTLSIALETCLMRVALGRRP